MAIRYRIASVNLVVCSLINIFNFSVMLIASDYPKSLEEVLAHIEKLEQPTELAIKAFDYREKTEFFERAAISGNLKLVIWEATESTGNFRSDLYVRSHSYFFTATRHASDKPWLLTSFISPISEQAERVMEEQWRVFGRSLMFRERVVGNRLRAILTQPNIVEVKLEPADSDGLVKLSMRIPNPLAKLQDEYAGIHPLYVTHGEVRLDPNQQYCVASTSFAFSRSDDRGTIRVLEWGEKDGRKYPQKTLHSYDKEGDIDISEVVSIRFDKVPEHEFTLEAFGLPNPYASSASDTVLSPTVIMVVVGVCFLALGLTLRFMKKS